VRGDARATDQEQPEGSRQDDGNRREGILVVRDGPGDRMNRRDGVTDGGGDLDVIHR
jgi:hypothetical protein